MNRTYCFNRLPYVPVFGVLISADKKGRMLTPATEIPLKRMDHLSSCHTTTSRYGYRNTYSHHRDSLLTRHRNWMFEYLNFWTICWKAISLTPTLTPASNRSPLLHPVVSPLLPQCIRPNQCSTILACSLYRCYSFFDWMSSETLASTGIRPWFLCAKLTNDLRRIRWKSNSILSVHFTFSYIPL
jgi:hypothetical protein